MRVGVVRATGLVAVLGSLAILLASGARDLEAQTAELLAGAVDGGFEAGGAGWFAPTNSRLVLDGDGPVYGGVQAGRIEATAQGPIGIRSQYWLVPTVAQVPHTLRLWLYDDDPRTSTIEVELEFLKPDGLPRNALIEPIGSSTSGWRLVTITLSGLEGTAYARIEVRAYANAAGARFFVDDVSLERDPLPPPTPTPTATTTPVATPTASVTPTTTATATSTATASPTPASTATPTSTAGSGGGVFDVLTNGDFGDGLYGWSDVGADVEAAGGGARMTSQSTSTKYLYQVVRVSPGGWYEGAAHLVTGAGADAAWMRIAWYASNDGSGSQLATADSGTLGGGASGEVRTGPVQAPLEAHTAHVRIMLRPLSSPLAQVTVDDVRFDVSSAPPPLAPTPAPTSTAGSVTSQPPSVAPPAAVGAPSPASDGGSAPRLVAGRPVEAGSGATASGSGSGSASGGGGSGNTRAPSSGGGSGSPAPASTAVAQLEGFAPEILLRITELMPDPTEPGNDADFEWIEVSNVGTAPIALAGMLLRDNASSLALPDLVLQGGTSLVLAGPRAAVPGASAFWPPGGLFNGLGNSGDRLALFTADGRLIDALSYGSDTTYDNPPLLPPGPGRSLKRFFGDDGTYAGAEVSDAPSPGRFEPPPVRAADSEGATARTGAASIEGGGGADRSTWYVLGGLGVVALAGAAAQRVWALRHEVERGASAEAGSPRSPV